VVLTNEAMLEKANLEKSGSQPPLRDWSVLSNPTQDAIR